MPTLYEKTFSAVSSPVYKTNTELTEVDITSYKTASYDKKDICTLPAIVGRDNQGRHRRLDTLQRRHRPDAIQHQETAHLQRTLIPLLRRKILPRRTHPIRLYDPPYIRVSSGDQISLHGNLMLIIATYFKTETSGNNYFCICETV